MSDVTCYTILSRDVELLDWCISNAKERAGVDHEWLLVGWDCTPEVVKYCKDHDVRLVRHKATDKSAHADHTAWFLHNLYACWNKGYEASKTKWVARMGSDQFFSKDWLKNLLAAADAKGDDAIYHTWTVESSAAIGSRHEVANWGTTWDAFNERQFDLHANDLIHRYQHTPALTAAESGLWYRHPARGLQLRPDGVTWLQTRKLWEEFGPLSDELNAEGVTGDVSYMDALTDAGKAGYVVPTSVSYHLVQGETRQRADGE